MAERTGETPEVDAVVFNFANQHPAININQDVVRADFARSLESRLRAMEAEKKAAVNVIDEAASRLRFLMLDCEDCAREAGQDSGEARAWRAVAAMAKKIETELSAELRTPAKARNEGEGK